MFPANWLEFYWVEFQWRSRLGFPSLYYLDSAAWTCFCSENCVKRIDKKGFLLVCLFLFCVFLKYPVLKLFSVVLAFREISPLIVCSQLWFECKRISLSWSSSSPTGNGSSILWHCEVTSRNSGSWLSSGYTSIIRWVMVRPGLSNVTVNEVQRN